MSRQFLSPQELEQTFFATLSRLIKNQVPQAKQTGFAVAYSGGLDSSVLLTLAHKFAQQEKIPLFAFHVNHGLSGNALDWQRHCAQIAVALNVRFEFAQVLVQNNGDGIEASARALRYRELGRLCGAQNLSLLLTAHHIDDQAETILMQLFRGTGLRGLAGMDDFNFAPNLFGIDSLRLARPLLFANKLSLQTYAQSQQVTHIEDESNSQTRFKRNAVRHLLMPEIENISPHFSERIARASSHIRSANRILDEVASMDLKTCSVEDSLQVDLLQALSRDRRANVFRFWLTQHGIKLPSTAKTEEILAQAFDAREDARVSLQHANFALFRYDGKLSLVEINALSHFVGEIQFRWQGQFEYAIPQLKGRLRFQPAVVGIDADFLRDHALCIRQRVGGERLRLASNRPSRDMKSHFQSLRIPFWQREKLPYLYIGNKLAFVGLVGSDAAFLSEKADEKIELIWVPD